MGCIDTCRLVDGYLMQQQRSNSHERGKYGFELLLQSDSLGVQVCTSLMNNLWSPSNAGDQPITTNQPTSYLSLPKVARIRNKSNSEVQSEMIPQIQQIIPF